MVIWESVHSTAIAAIGYELGPSEVKLNIHVHFKQPPGPDGANTYVYDCGDNNRYYDGLKHAASKGRFYIHVIKARFDYQRKYAS